MTVLLGSSLYPSTYRMPVWKGGLKILGIMFLYLLGVLGKTHIIDRGVSNWVLIWIAVLAIGLVLIFINTFFAKITLYSDRIERQTWFSKKTMRRDDVAGMRRGGGLLGLSKAILLVSKSSPYERFFLQGGLKTDAAWDAWMAIAVDLDAMDKEKKAALKNRPT